MGDFLFGFILGRVIIGLFRLYFKLLWFLARIGWWLIMLLLFSLGAGIGWLARGGHGRPADTGRFGEFTQDSAQWRDDASGTAYPVVSGQYETCEVQAEEAGTYWRSTAISRMLRQGAIMRYRFVAVIDGTGERAAWCEFPHEARKNIRLDELNPAYAGAPELIGAGAAATEANRDRVMEARGVMKSLLAARGWEQEDDETTNPSRPHWYADRYTRPVISWNAPGPVAAPAGEPAAVCAEQSKGAQ
jgi:hypothetical protein